MSDSISSFFINLSNRFYSENDISDITWAMCQGSPAFRNHWLRFFFPNIDVDDVDTIAREITDNKGGSRVDFYITMKSEELPYIIEVKKYDANHHFGQYEEAFDIDKSRFGYIVNYSLQESGYTIKTWEGFYKSLKRGLKNFKGEDEILVKGYINYLKTVCGMVTFDKIGNIKETKNLYALTVALRDIVKDSNDVYTSNEYTSNRRHGHDDSLQVVAQVKLKHGGSELNGQIFWPTIGLWYKEEAIFIGYPSKDYDSWYGCQKVCDMINTHKHSINKVPLKYSTMEDGQDGYWFRLNDIDFEQGSYDEQKELLREFFREVLMFPIRLEELD